jgi:hypothetical protein
MSAALARRKKQKEKAAAALAADETGLASTALNTEARVLELLSRSDDTAHYEALQLLSSNTHRSLRAGDIESAISTSYKGTLTLLTAKHVELANQLSAMYVTTLVDSRTRESPERAAECAAISAAYSANYAASAGMDVANRKVHDGHVKFLKAFVKYSALLGDTVDGTFELHLMLAEACFAGGDYLQAATHFGYAEAPTRIVDLAMALPAEERDACILTAGLTMMCMENMRDASKLVITYKIKLGAEEPCRTAVLMVWLLEICKKDAAPLYQWLMGAFKNEINSDPVYPGLMTTIGKKYFDIKPPPNMLSMLENMMGGGGK